MGKKAKVDEQPPGAPMWMATFGDLMSLLLTFFILLISFSTIEEEDYNKAMGSLQGALGTLTDPFYQVNLINRERYKPSSYHYRFIRWGTVSKFKEQELQLLTEGQPHTNNLEDVAEEVTSYAQGAGIANLVSVGTSEKGIMIRLPSVLLFEEGNDVLKKDAATESLLKKVILLTKSLPYSLSVEGHTDDTPIANPEFASNWELSSKRAIAVLEYFVGQEVAPERLQAVGHGSFKPYASNQTLRGRKLNRRVEINLDVTRGL